MTKQYFTGFLDLPGLFSEKERKNIFFEGLELVTTGSFIEWTASNFDVP